MMKHFVISLILSIGCFGYVSASEGALSSYNTVELSSGGPGGEWKHKKRLKNRRRGNRWKGGFFRLFDDRGARKHGAVKGKNRRWKKDRQRKLQHQFPL